MRTFWQTIAMLLLVLFAPASMHCLIGGMVDQTHTTASVSAQVNENEGHSSLPGTPEHQEHGCPTDTLAKTSLPSGVNVPAIPSTILEDALAALRRIAAQIFFNGDALAVAPSVAPEELQPSWVFTSRAALPARWPSDLA